jgi:hypothetical protein
VKRSLAKRSRAKHSYIQTEISSSECSEVKTSRAQRSTAQQSKVFFKNNKTMTHKEALQVSRHKKLVASDKFDRHMARARVKDISSRKSMFDRQTQDEEERRTHNSTIISSVY